MKKVILSLPGPCHEKWEEMNPVEKGRYCNACQKTVIDFSEMTDAQLGAFFRKPVGSFCGRFHEDQLGREFVIPKKKIPWVKYFFQIALPAFLFSIKAYSQKTVSQKQVVQTIGNKKHEPQSFIPLQQIKGQVTDSSGSPVPFATISAVNSIKSTAADELGNFELNVQTGDSTIIVSAIGYQSIQYQVNDNKFVTITLKHKSAEMELVTIVSNGGYRLGGGKLSYSTIRPYLTMSRIVDTVFSVFTIYPNPIASNSVINMKTSRIEEGNYLASIFDGKGSVVQLSSVSFQGKDAKIELPIGNVASGTYFLNLRNKKSGKQYTKKLIVQ